MSNQLSTLKASLRMINIDTIQKLSKICRDKSKLYQERDNYRNLIEQTAREIKESIIPEAIPNLLFHLAFEEICLCNDSIGTPVNDYSSYARHLRALCAAIDFSNYNFIVDSKVDDLICKCNFLWENLFCEHLLRHHGIHKNPLDNKRQYFASMMSLLESVQLEQIYREQAEGRINSIYEFFSNEVIVPELGISANDAISGFNRIYEISSERLSEIQQLIYQKKQLEHILQNKTQQKIIRTKINPYLKTKESIELDRTTSLIEEKINCFLFYNITDLHKVFDRKKAECFFNAFSFTPGKVNLEYSTPYDNDIVRSRPFARVDKKFLLFEISYISFSPLNMFPELFTSEKLRSKLNKRRDSILESNTYKILKSINKSGKTIKNYYLPVGINQDMAERDILTFSKSNLAIIACKAKPLRSISGHQGNIKKINSDFKKSIQAAYMQCLSTAQFILDHKKNSSIKFFSDQQRKKVCLELNRKDIKVVKSIVVTDSYFGTISTDLSLWLNVDNKIGYPWVVNQYDLETIVTKIDSMQSLHSFINWRIRQHGVAYNEDEVVFAGHFLKHGHHPFPAKTSTVYLNPNLVDMFDDIYFQKKGAPSRYDHSPTTPQFTLVSNEVVDPKIIINNMIDKRVDGMNLHKDNNRSKIGRNQKCPCGSGKKFKRCCINKTSKMDHL